MSSTHLDQALVTLEYDLKAARRFIAIVIGFTGFAALMLVLAYVYHFRDTPMSDTPDRWGQLGDYIGGCVNPILSLASIVVLFRTLVFQTQQIRLAQFTLQHQRAEGAMEAFEKRFFALIELWRTRASEITWRVGSGETVRGEHAFRDLWRQLAQKLEANAPNLQLFHESEPWTHHFRLLEGVALYIIQHNPVQTSFYKEMLLMNLFPSEIRLCALYSACFAGAFATLFNPGELAQLVDEGDRRLLQRHLNNRESK